MKSVYLDWGQRRPQNKEELLNSAMRKGRLFQRKGTACAMDPRQKGTLQEPERAYWGWGLAGGRDCVC